MKIVIVGVGRMGFDLAQQLDREGHEVFVVDREPRRVELVRTRLDVMAIVGSGSGLKALREASVGDADLLIAATNSDEVNIVSCLVARDMGIQRRIARVQSMQLSTDLQDIDPALLGVDEFINPMQVTVDRLCHMVATPGTAESAEFADGRIVLRALQVGEGSPLTQGSLEDQRRRFEEPFLICLVRRNKELIVPSGEFHLAGGDIAYAVLEAASLEPFLTAYGFQKEQTRRLVVFGGERLGRALCAALESSVSDVILLEPDEAICAEAAETLAHASVVHGSPLDLALVEDLKFGGVNFFIGASQSDELNLSSALLAKRLGVGRSVMVTSQPEHVDLFESVPVDAVVSPLMLSVGAVLRAVRQGRVVSLFKLAGGRGEALEIEVSSTAPVVDRPLREVGRELGAGVVVAAVLTPEGARLAGGDTVMRAGDRAVVIGQQEACERAAGALSGGATG